MKKKIVYLTAFLGALGAGFQSFMAFIIFLDKISNFSSLLKLLISGVLNLYSSLINFAMNIGLLWDFFERISGKKPKPFLSGWQKFRYYAGSALFIVTGLLFALTIVAFAPTGILAITGTIAGVFAGIMMMIQQLETWLQSFPTDEKKQLSLWEKFSKWYKNLTAPQIIGFVIALGNLLALSLLLTLGLSSFLLSLGVATFPAIVIGMTIACTMGAFTQFHFTNTFISNFCTNFLVRCQLLWKSKGAAFGILSILTNGGVNAALFYAGVLMLGSLLLSAGIVFPVLPFAIISAIFGGIASILLGSEFWITNCEKIVNWRINNFMESAPLDQELIRYENDSPECLDDPDETLPLLNIPIEGKSNDRRFFKGNRYTPVSDNDSEENMTLGL